MQVTADMGVKSRRNWEKQQQKKNTTKNKTTTTNKQKNRQTKTYKGKYSLYIIFLYMDGLQSTSV
jgi:hypothetical protein